MRYKLEAGRCILRDGKPFVSISGCASRVTGEGFDPTAWDKFARDVVERFNAEPFDTGRQAITTKFLGPTTHRGSRVKATAAAGSITLNWDSYLNSDQNHLAAAQALANRYGWEGQLIGGGLPDQTGNAYVLVYRGE